MKSVVKFAWMGATTISAILVAAIVQAGGWDNFQLRYTFLTQVFYDQTQELGDLRKQGQDLEATARIDLTELLNGGPPKDGIPSLDAPKFDTAETTTFGEETLVIGVMINGEAKAYPLNIMNWHEIVNDTVGGVNLTVSYCPLCDTIVAFEREETTYGVSGKLYQSCLIMYNRADDTLYAQPWGLGVMGPEVNTSLVRVPVTKTTLGAWIDAHPDSQILSTETGYERDYQRYPYGSYYTDNRIIFEVRDQGERTLHPKAIVSYIWEADDQTPHNQFSGSSAQFVHAELQQVSNQVVDFNGRSVQARWDEALATVVVTEMDGTTIPSSTAFSFVYPAFF